MSTRFVRAIGRGWLQEELYGWRHAPSIAACQIPYLYAKVMLYASGASPSKLAQREYVAGMLSAHFAGSLDSGLLEYVNHFDRTHSTAPALPADIPSESESHLPGPIRRLPQVNARVIVYDALSTAMLDGALPTDAASDISCVARELGVTTKTAKRITRVCEREAGLEERRRRLLLGDECSPIA